jgi:hypothetical protein
LRTRELPQLPKLTVRSVPPQALSYAAVNEMMSGQTDRRPGDFSLDPFKQTSPAMLEKEISHCRLAMFAFSGVVTQSALAGHGFPYL